MAATNRTALMLLAAIVLAGGWLRFNGLGEQSLWYDEVFTWDQSRGSVGRLLRMTSLDNYPPLHNLLTWISLHVLGDSPWTLRLPSAILSTLNIAAIYALAARLGGPLAGLFAATLLALSGFHIWYAQEARMYALLALMATLLALSLHMRLMSGTRASGWFAYLSAVGLFYSHPYGSLTWVALLAATVAAARAAPGFWEKPLRSLIRSQALALLTFAPWALLLSRQATHVATHGFWIPPPTPDYVLDQAVMLATGPYLLALLAAGALLAIAGALAARREAQDPASANRALGAVAFLLAWLLLPALAGIAASFITIPVFVGRYVIGSLPALIILASIGLALIARTAPRLLAVAVVTVTAAVMGLGHFSPAERERWREIAPYVAAELTDTACVIVTPDHYIRALNHYLPEPPDCVLPASADPALGTFPPTADRIVLVITATGRLLDQAVPPARAAWPVTAEAWFGSTAVLTLSPP